MSAQSAKSQIIPPVLTDSLPLALRLRLWRNRLVASPRFRQLIARLPLLRSIGNRKANDLFRLTGGFIFSQVLLAGVRLGLYETLQGAPATTGVLAAHLGIPEGRLRVLLRANVCLGLLLEPAPDLWVLDDAGAVLASDRGLGAMVLHHAMLYRDLTEPDHLLRTAGAQTELRQYWAYVRDMGTGGPQAAEVDGYSLLMRESQAMMADCILAAHDFGQTRILLDVGGGDGAFLAAAADRHASLQLRLFDLPAVADRAVCHLESLGLGARTRVHGGDFVRDPLPDDADCVTLVRILCDHDDSRVAALLANLHRSLRPGTTLIVAEAMDGTSEGARLSAAYFGFYFLAMGSGRCRSAQEIAGFLSSTGFQAVRTVTTSNPLIATLVTARR
ncbi:methyltransferase [Niveispirillum cyanobacteriorum]|uniref:Methyltransferase n=1 Tax=Niveispirillum cyanobacteriorum TaxID=1612173 RepID=A0A2K9NGV1_9PROT|nr:methyltransferase [Niveispirillum cyanobacteriorum]AUN32313.1 methyltransferase [Niveispirillum cyanobacteriorum]GGE76251.1 O-methyltransferase [Niveispirillum cyanobacteriorum]